LCILFLFFLPKISGGWQPENFLTGLLLNLLKLFLLIALGYTGQENINRSTFYFGAFPSFIF
jgi:hypothetical protein